MVSKRREKFEIEKSHTGPLSPCFQAITRSGPNFYQTALYPYLYLYIYALSGHDLHSQTFCELFDLFQLFGQVLRHLPVIDGSDLHRNLC